MASQQTKLMALSHHHNHQDEVWGAPGVKGKRVITIPSDDEALTDLIQSIIISKNQELKDNPSFYVLDLGRVVTVMNTWNNSLANILPYYAVKCNPNRAFLGALASLGAGFDCATRAEIEIVLSLGVSPDRIVYANPCKTESHIRYAAQVGVNLTTFDSKYEVDKIKKWHPKCGLLLRIKSPDDEGAHHPLGRKYGALPEEFVPLLEAAQAANLLVHGVSFHVGSAATHSRGYSSSIEAAKSIFDTAFRLGMPRMHVINIGGGFTMGKQFEDASITIKTSIQKHFPNHESEGISLMSEPGRFFAETCFTLVTTIIGKRVRGEMKEYWISDGIYGSMNRLVYGFESMKAMPLACSSNRANPTCRGTKTYGSTVFGPTCDALDTLLTEYQLPELEVNDWLVWPNMGAYTSSAGSSFNGFNTSSIPTFLAYSNPPLN